MSDLSVRSLCFCVRLVGHLNQEREKVEGREEEQAEEQTEEKAE